MSSQHSHSVTESLTRALAVRDLTDPAQGPHAMQELVRELHEALAALWHCRRQLYRPPVLVAHRDCGPLAEPAAPVASDYLLRPPGGTMLPSLLAGLTLDPPDDLLVVCPGLTYRNNTAATHQLDLWRVRRGRLDAPQMAEAVRLLLQRALPGSAYRLLPVRHAGLQQAMRIAVRHEGDWLEVGVCGLVEPETLARHGLSSDRHAVLSITLELDDLVTARKRLPSRLLLRSDKPEVAAQMLDLAPYRGLDAAASDRQTLRVGVS